MPWWVIVYIGAIALFAIYGQIENFTKVGIWHHVADAVAVVSIIYLGCSYWLPELLAVIGYFSYVLLLIAVLWLPYNIYTETKFTNTEAKIILAKDELSSSIKLNSAILTTTFILILTAPLYYWSIYSVVTNATKFT